MDHSETSSSPHRCPDHKSPDNCGQPIFYTTRLCEKRIYPKGDFDLTDPNGYRLGTDYNCLHDPNLKTYLYRKDIHKHLLRDGFITKDNKVTCRFKEFNTYKNYLTEVQREVDHRFQTEQRELVRKILILQEEGEISHDLSVSDFIEWLVFHGQDYVENDTDRSRPKKSQSCSSNVLKLPKVNSQSKSLNKSHCSDTVYNTHQQQMLKQVVEDVRRELRLERRWNKTQHQREQQRKKWHEPDVAIQVQRLKSSLTGIRKASLKEGKAASEDTLMRRRPTLKKLDPLPHREKMNLMSNCVYAETAVIAGETNKNTHILKPRATFDNRDTSVITPLKLVPLKTNVSSSPGDTGGDCLATVTALQHRLNSADQHVQIEQKPTEDKDKIYNLTEENPQIITNIVTRVMDDIMGVIIPAMRQFIDESSPVKQSYFKDTQTTHNDHLSIICHVEDTKPDDGILPHASCVPAPMSHQSSTHYCQKPDSSMIESLLGGECDPLNTDLVEKAERVIWKAIQEAVEEIKTLVAFAVNRAESQCRSSEEHGQKLKSTSGNTHEGFYGGDKVFLDKPSVSVVNPQAQRESMACAQQMFMNHEAAKIAEVNSGNQVKAQLPEPRLCFSEHNSCDTAQKNLIYSQFVEDILVRVYSLFSAESTETISQTETISLPSSSPSSSSRMQNECLPLLAEMFNSGPVCSVALRNASASPKLPVGQTIRLLAARPVTSGDEVMAAETEPYVDEMIMDIMDQIKYETEQQSRESKYLETPDSSISSEGSVMMGDFPLVIKLNHQPLSPSKTRHREALEISHQIFLYIKRQLDEGHSNTEADVSKTMEKGILCEFVEMALDKLSNMCNPKYPITKTVEMKSCVLEDFESPQPKNSLNDSEIMEDAKMQFEKAACQSVKAVLENALSYFLSHGVDRSKCGSRESLSSAMGNNQTDLSSLASDIVFIVWEKLIETSGCNTSALTSSNTETKLKDLMKTISEISSLNPSAADADLPTLKAKLAMEEINCALKTKVIHFVTQESKGCQRETDMDPMVKKTAIIQRSADVMNCHSKPAQSCGQDLHNSVVSITSESAVEHSNGNSLCPKQTYTSSQISTPEHDNFSGALSESAMSLLKDTYGEQATSMKTKKDASTFLADPTFEGLVIQPHANGRDLIVQKVAVEELSSVYRADSIQSEGNHQKSTQIPSSKPQEVLCPSFPEQVDVESKANVRIHRSQITQPNDQARPSSAMLYYTIEKVTLEVIEKCMLGPEFITKQGVESCEMQKLRRTQSAKPANKRENITKRHRMLEVTQAFESPQKTLSDLTAKPVNACRPHSAAVDYRGVKQTSGSRDSTALNVLCSSQDQHNHSKLQRQTQSRSASRASLKKQDMFWKSFRKAQTSVTDGSGKGSGPMKANAVQQQGNGDKVLLSTQGTDRDTPPLLAETVKDIVANLLVNIYSDAPNTPSCTSSPISDPASLNLLDSVLVQMKRFHKLDEVNAEQLSSAYIDIQEVAQSVYRDLVCCWGSCSNLHLAISACEDRIVEKIASLLAQSLSFSIQHKDDLNHDNLNSRTSTRLSSLASTQLSSPTSWVTEEALKISERSSTCSLEMAEDLVDAVMVELYTDPEKFVTPQPDYLDWPQLSLAELNQAATEVYKYMLEQCGSVENLQGALRSREKEVVTKMAIAIASQTYKLISLKESSDTPLPDQTSKLSDSLSVCSSAQLHSTAQCALFYQSVWDIISALMLELCKKKAQGQHLTPKLFLKSLRTLSECPGVKICSDNKLCDISNDSNAIEWIVLGARRRLSDDPDNWCSLESLLASKDEAAAERVVITVVEEILKFASHPFDVIQVPATNLYHSEHASGMTQDLPANFVFWPSDDVSSQDADLNSRCENPQTSYVCSLHAGKPRSAPDSRDKAPVSRDITKGNSCQSSTVGSKKVTFMPFTQVDYNSKSVVPLKRGSKVSDEAEHPAIHLRGRRVISVKIKKHSNKGRPARPRKPQNYVENKTDTETTLVKSLGSLLSKFFHV